MILFSRLKRRIVRGRLRCTGRLRWDHFPEQRCVVLACFHSLRMVRSYTPFIFAKSPLVEGTGFFIAILLCTPLCQASKRFGLHRMIRIWLLLKDLHSPVIDHVGLCMATLHVVEFSQNRESSSC